MQTNLFLTDEGFFFVSLYWINIIVWALKTFCLSFPPISCKGISGNLNTQAHAMWQHARWNIFLLNLVLWLAIRGAKGFSPKATFSPLLSCFLSVFLLLPFFSPDTWLMHIHQLSFSSLACWEKKKHLQLQRDTFTHVLEGSFWHTNSHLLPVWPESLSIFLQF